MSVAGSDEPLAGAEASGDPVTLSGNTYMPPVARSTPIIPIRPPKRMLPMYQPLTVG